SDISNSASIDSLKSFSIPGLHLQHRRASSYDDQLHSFAEGLRDSLSNTLNVYYPFAGRYKDTFSIDCNDAGVDFVRARVACDMSDALHQQAVDEDRLLPFLACRPQGGAWIRTASWCF
ncbi:unnamed protein product, partial [Linum tenue]